MEPTMVPVILRGAERCLIAIGAIFIAYLGYKLFAHGIEKGRGELRIQKSLVGDIVFSGTGPGVFFMAFGALVLLTGLLRGGGSSEQSYSQWHTALPSSDGTPADASDPNMSVCRTPISRRAYTSISKCILHDECLQYSLEKDGHGDAWLCLETAKARTPDPNTRILKDEPGKQKGTQ